MFYAENPDDWKLWARFGCLTVEMETSGQHRSAMRPDFKEFSQIFTNFEEFT
jgi:purine-nucleoside phosphorylase